MRVALLSYNAQAHDAVGNQIAEKAACFLERGAELRLFVQSADRLHPELRPYCQQVQRPERSGPAWEYLASSDLVIVVYAQSHDLLQYLPLLAGGKPRLLLHYHGVTPPELWHTPHNAALQQALQQRGFVWCADLALTDSQFARQELLDATEFPDTRVAHLPLPVDLGRFRPDPGDRFLHERLGLDPRARLLLYVGRLAGNKRVPLLVEALAHLRDDEPATHAVLVGDDRDVYRLEAERCRSLAAELGVGDRLHVVGRLDEAQLVRAYRSADMLVMPSLHEGFCMPVIEAMASGLPVVAARAAALPETVGDGGLTFAADDVEDLVRQVRRVRAATPRPARVGRVALVSFRFGPDVVGGAETSLRTLAHALQHAGQQVEVFSTCNRHESRWHNELSPGSETVAGLTVHRFPVDAHARAAHGKVVAQVLDADGRVAPETELRYLAHSIHSQALVAALQQRRDEFDAVIVGPYLFGLTHDVACALPDKTLLVPCFHDEPIARLRAWPEAYGRVAGILYHSPEEQDYAQARLGINHPNSCVLGAFLDLPALQANPAHVSARPYVVYCGRYSEQKRVPELLEWAERYQEDQPGRFDFVFVGQGEVTLPRRSWLHDLGRLDDRAKAGVLAGARALVQLSRQESLSLVALEAWARETPVIVQRRCRVLNAQVERSHGGAAVDDYDSFAAALDDLWQRPDAWRARGRCGHDYVQAHHASRADYVERVLQAIERMRLPLREQMRQSGLQRAGRCERSTWRTALGQLIDELMDRPARPYREDIGIQPYQADCRVAWGTRTVLLPLRLFNWGTHASAAEGPGRTLLHHAITDLRTGDAAVPGQTTELAGLLVPGRAQTVVVALSIPPQPGQYRIALWTARAGDTAAPAFRVQLPLLVEARGAVDAPSCAAPLLDDLSRTLPEAKRMQKLPDDYDDISEGRLGGVKRYVKRKLLNNFKQAYLDVLSRQQSQVNAQLIVAVQQLGECCAVLDKAVLGLQQRLDQVETRIEQLMGETAAAAARSGESSDSMDWYHTGSRAGAV